MEKKVIRSYQTIMFEETMKELKNKTGESQTGDALRFAVEFTLEHYKEAE